MTRNLNFFIIFFELNKALVFFMHQGIRASIHRMERTGLKKKKANLLG